MLYFHCDYTQGAHPSILRLLQETNLEQTMGYGEDVYCQKATEWICRACNAEDAGVHFFSGGTQANLTVIKSALRPHQAVISPHSGHIHVHETGAVEATGHKILALPGGTAGKITAKQVADLCAAHNSDAAREHMAQPKMVYISFSTENGMLYTRHELLALRRVCDEYGLFLFLDGARLAYGLSAATCDVTLPDLYRACDVFTIGGTKCGALFGEAVVIRNPGLQRDFRYILKQTGAMLAKGRILGIQFYALFQEDLYFALGNTANQLAKEIAEACKAAGFPLLVESPTNQQFVILPHRLLKKLDEEFTYTVWERVDEAHTAIRLCTSWATTREEVQRLIACIAQLGAAEGENK